MMPYSLHVALLLTACWLFYKLLLQNETYYRLNRVLLLACIALAFLLPLVPVPQQYSMRSAVVSTAETTAPVVSKNTVSNGPANIAQQKTTVAPVKANSTDKAAPTLNWRSIVQWTFWLYWFGVLVFGANFLVQIIALIYKAYSKPVINDGQFRIVELDSDDAPCSFGNNIFINPAKYDWETYNQILMHEKVHARQRHSADLIIAELMLVLQWFNPFAWLYRKEMESNMEFLTDEAVIRDNQVAAEEYQMSLLKVSVPNYAMRVTTNYNQSLLKRRIMMMNTKRSNLHSMWKYAMLMPFMAIMLCGFNEPVDTSIKPLVTAARKVSNKITVALLPDTIHKARPARKTNAAVKKTVIAAAISEKPKTLTAADIRALDEAGITAEYIKSFADIGYKYMSVATLTGFDDEGISAAYVKSFMDIGFDVKPATILAFDEEGISAAYVKGFMDIKFPNLSTATILAFDEDGISAAYVKGLMDGGYTDLSVANILAFDNEGINASYVKGLKTAGIKDMSVASILAFDKEGISPDYIKGLTTSGLTEPSAATILAFDKQGISVDYVKALVGLGIADMTPANIMAFDKKGISIDYTKGLLNTGLKKLTPAMILAFSDQGVSVDYVKGVLGAGLKQASPADILAFDKAGVSPDYIKSLSKIGIDGLTTETIIKNNNNGNSAKDVKAKNAVKN